MKRSDGKVLAFGKTLTPDDEEFFSPKEHLERQIEHNFEAIITFGIKEGASYIGWSNMDDLQQIIGAMVQMQNRLLNDHE